MSLYKRYVQVYSYLQIMLALMYIYSFSCIALHNFKTMYIVNCAITHDKIQEIIIENEFIQKSLQSVDTITTP